MNEKVKDGGPAFPGGERWRTLDLVGHETAHARAPYNAGLTLRDYFAAKAMPFVAGRADIDNTGPIEWANACYEIADAMIAAREPRP